jgi:hypothetical protein
MHGLVQINTQFFLCLDSRSKCLLPPLHLIRRLLRPKFIMDDFEGPSLFDGAVCGGAVWAIDHFARSGVDRFAQGKTLHVFKIGATETFEVDAPVGLFEKDTGTCLIEKLSITYHSGKKDTHLAYTLEYGHCVFEIANVEHWDYQLDVGIVAYAFN